MYVFNFRFLFLVFSFWREICSLCVFYTLCAYTLEKPKKKKNPEQGNIRNLRLNQRGGILLSGLDRCAIDVTCTEHNDMIITVYLECIKHP